MQQISFVIWPVLIVICIEMIECIIHMEIQTYHQTHS